MSDNSSDDSFASAEEGSDKEYNLIETIHENLLKSDDVLESLPSAPAVGSARITCRALMMGEEGLGDNFRSQTDESTLILDNEMRKLPLTSSSNDIDDSTQQCHSSGLWSLPPNETLQGGVQDSTSVDFTQPLIQFEQIPMDQAIEFTHDEKGYPSSNLAKVFSNSETLARAEVGNFEGDGCGSPQSINSESPLIGKKERSSNGVASTHTGCPKDASSRNVKNTDVCNVNASRKETGNLIGSGKGLDTWDLEDDPWTASPILSPDALPTTEYLTSDEKIKEENLNLENESWTRPRSGSIVHLLVNTDETSSRPAFEQTLVLGEEKRTTEVKSLNAEIYDWDLEGDTNARTRKVTSDTCLASDDTRYDVRKDEWDLETETDWDNVEDLQVKTPAINTTQELTSAATALVKSVGGGLASIVESLKLSKLSSTLAAFEEKAPVLTSTECEQKATKQEASGSHSGVNADVSETKGGWGTWNLGSLANYLTSTVENTGLQIIHGGVDVLEHIGRKTFTALKENDPGLVYTKRFLRPVDNCQVSKLSQDLREARDHYAVQLSSDLSSREGASRRGDLASQLEARLALVHMEALELLSSRASARLGAKLTRLEACQDKNDDEHSRSINSLTKEGGVLERIWRTLQLKGPEGESLAETDISVPTTALFDAVKVLEAITPGNAFLKTCKEVEQNSENTEFDMPMKEIFYRAVEALADVTSAVLAYLHKLTECLLLLSQNRSQFNTGFLDVADNVAIVLTATKRQNENLCSTYVELLKKTASDDTMKQLEGGSEEALKSCRRLVASLFLEVGTANGYLDDAAANFLVPVLQYACLEAFFPESTPPPASCRPPAVFKTKQH